MFEETVEEMVATMVSPPQARYSRWSMGEFTWKVGVDEQVILATVKAYDRALRRQRRVRGSKGLLFGEKVQNVMRLCLNESLLGTGH